MNRFYISIFIFAIPLFSQTSQIIPFNKGCWFTGQFKLNESNLNFAQEQYKYEDFSSNIVGQKSVGLAFFMSLAVPGSGEIYMGKTGQGILFLSSEVLIWTGLAINNAYVNHLKEEYHIYANQHANVNPKGKDLQYWIDIGKYNSIYEFNEQRRRDRYFDEIYEENEVNFWQWDSEKNRIRYDRKRLSSGEIASHDVYFYASVLLNHVISGINSMRLARQHNRDIMEKTRWSFSLDPYDRNYGRIYGANFSVTF